MVLRKIFILSSLVMVILTSCIPLAGFLSGQQLTPTPAEPTPPLDRVPAFSHIVILIFENKESDQVIGNQEMPNFNRLAGEYTLLTQHYAIQHPSLPNYIALIGGDTFGIKKDNPGITIDAPNITDLIEQSGLTWKTYQESMPGPCYLKDVYPYAQKHNPFIFFNSIRDNAQRCSNHVVPIEDLDTDLKQGTLPNFAFITPNICDDAHDSSTNPTKCSLRVTDSWLKGWVDRLLADSQISKDGLIILTWDEGDSDHSCCGLSTGGGRIATVLISPLVKSGFRDDTPYTHYSILRLISESWRLPIIGHASDPGTNPIRAPWK